MSAKRTRIEPREFRAYSRAHFDRIEQLRCLDPHELLDMKAVAEVFPFRVNSYVVEELIDWNNVPEDPMFQLVFPQPGMLASEDLARIRNLIEQERGNGELKREVAQLHEKLNPHPAGQMELNVPMLNGKPMAGTQHKYRETVLFFPSQGQTCHAYCTYCFRWAQFIGIDDLKFASREADRLRRYLSEHREVQDILFTGGDPMIMKTKLLERYIEPLLDIEHLITIRIGTKALAFWPYRFLTDRDADDLMRLFERVRKAGKHLAIMAHYSHPRELSTRVGQAALRRVQSAGGVVRCQAPLIRHVNDSATIWAEMWRLQVQLGAVPYYMFVERDTGPKDYFEVPLARAYEIYRTAKRRVSGLARTARGPSMSATPGKVVVDGITTIANERVFVLRFIQARHPQWVSRPFFARFDPCATWLSDLEPAFGEKEFFFRPELEKIAAMSRAPAWGERLRPRATPTIFGHVEWE